jgi:hypothetical protein
VIFVFWSWQSHVFVQVIPISLRAYLVIIDPVSKQ